MELQYKTLIVWQKAITVSNEVLSVLEDFPAKYQYNLSDQLKRAVISIPSNIAEGSGRIGENDKKRFYSIARGSVFETSSLLELVKLRGLMPAEKVQLLEEKLVEITRMLTVMIRKD